MNDENLNIVQKVILDRGGYSVFAERMGGNQSSTAIREIAEGRRIPTEETRRRMVRASRGRMTEQDIIAISGKTKHESGRKFDVDPMWDAEEPDLRYMIWQRARAGARKQRKSNERRKVK